jgi:translation initiation factor 4B
MRPDPSPAATPDVSTPASPAQEAPKERPRLNLAKRSVSTAENNAANTSSGDAKASPFGAARPIDTQQREREIEEKRELALRQKKEADDKAKEEKAAKDAAARAARGDRADRAQEDGETVTSPTGDRPRADRRPSRQNGAKQQPKENGEGARDRPSFSILQREEGEDAGEADAVDASANGNIIGDKETKPQEVVVPADGSAAPETTAEGLEDDGWSTVAAKPKNNRRGGGRAIAS